MKTDLIIPIGNDCRIAIYLDRLKLRKYAFPLDWMLNFSFNDILQLFSTDFKTFFTDISLNKDIKNGDNKLVVMDNRNKMLSLHHFPPDIPLPESQTNVRKLMLKRYKLLKGLIRFSRHITFISFRDEDEAAQIGFLENMFKITNKNLLLVNITSKQETKFREIIINGHLKIMQYEFNNSPLADYHYENDVSADMLGNINKWEEIVGQFKYSFYGKLMFWASKKIMRLKKMSKKQYKDKSVISR